MFKRKYLRRTRTALFEKMRESAISVLPIIIIVMILSLTVFPAQTDLMVCF